jgi:uncharacterized membrane protein YcaP (DUF421 family)
VGIPTGGVLGPPGRTPEHARRAGLIFTITLAIVRMDSKRFLGKATVFDIILGIMIGSVMSRAINGSAPFFRTVLAGMVLVAMHWTLAGLAFHTSWVGRWSRGSRSC